MTLKLLAPVYKTFTLDESDAKYGNEGDPTTIVVKQATQREHELRQDLFATMEQKYKALQPDEVTMVQTLSFELLKKTEAWLTLAECTYLDENEKPLFPSKKSKEGVPTLTMSKAQFFDAWGSLFPDVANEIHRKIREVNAIWRGAEGEDS
jgi:hypothetical protein